METVAGPLDRAVPKGSARDSGVIFCVEINGKTVLSRRVSSHELLPIKVDLTQWAGKSILLALVTDAAGAPALGWPIWLQPRITTRGKEGAIPHE